MIDEEDFEEGDSEPIGSCDNCECDVFECDAYEYDGGVLCGQCYWALTHGIPQTRRDSEKP